MKISDSATVRPIPHVPNAVPSTTMFVDIPQPDIAWMGGFRTCQAMSATATSANISVTPHGERGTYRGHAESGRRGHRRSCDRPGCWIR